MGTPVWSHDGIICTGESYKNVVHTYPSADRVGNGSEDAKEVDVMNCTFAVLACVQSPLICHSTSRSAS